MDMTVDVAGEQEEPLFTCKDCGAHDLVVTHEYTEVTHYDETLTCLCGRADDGVAARRTYHTRTPCRERGPLDESHRWEYEEVEREEGEAEEKDEYEVSCPECVEDAGEDDWDVETETEIDHEEYYVHCAGCGREIEFGWSHPERAGRIWPAECTDFNPWKSWPEPRYRGSWAAKNWLRPGFDQATGQRRRPPHHLGAIALL